MKTLPQPGNAIMEYALPLAVVLVTCGVLMTVGDIQKLMAKYFMSATGHTQADMQGTTLQVKMGPEPGTYQTGNGSEGFTNMGGVSDGNGQGLNSYHTVQDETGPESGSDYWEP